MTITLPVRLRRYFNTKRHAEEFAGSLGTDWHSRIYKGHRAYVCEYHRQEIKPERETEKTTTEKETV